MQIVLCNADGEIRKGLSLDEFLGEAREMRASNTFFWADLQSPTADEMTRIAEESGIHHLTTEDCLNRQSPVKLEETDNYLYLVTHVLNFNDGDEQLETLNLSIIMFPNFCLTVHVRPVRSAEVAMSHFNRRNVKGLSGSERVIYLVIQALTNYYSELIEKGTEEVDEIEEIVIQGKVDTIVLQRISDVGRELSVARRRLVPTQKILELLCSDEIESINESSEIYLRDALDGVVRLLEKSQVSREILNTAQANHLAQVANQTNVVMKTLSLVATIMMPLSFLTGLFGMNVHVPGQEEDSLIWFICLLALMALFAGLLLFMFKRKKWF